MSRPPTPDSAASAAPSGAALSTASSQDPHSSDAQCAVEESIDAFHECHHTYTDMLQQLASCNCKDADCAVLKTKVNKASDRLYIMDDALSTRIRESPAKVRDALETKLLNGLKEDKTKIKEVEAGLSRRHPDIRAQDQGQSVIPGPAGSKVAEWLLSP